MSEIVRLTEEQQEEILSTLIEIEPLNSDQFFKVKETLTRMGLVSRKRGEPKPTLWQSCHVLQKRGKYYILSFKNLFQLDGKLKETIFTEEDYDRVVLIANLLQDWGLVKIKEPNRFVYSEDSNTDVVVISYGEKSSWNLRAKYSIRVKEESVC